MGERCYTQRGQYVYTNMRALKYLFVDPEDYCDYRKQNGPGLVLPKQGIEKVQQRKHPVVEGASSRRPAAESEYKMKG